MFNIKHWLSILVISSFSLSAIIYSFLGDFDFDSKNKKKQQIAEGDDDSFMKHLYFFRIRDGNKSIDMFANRMDSIQLSSQTKLEYPIGNAYNSEQEPINFQGDQGLLDKKSDRIDLIGNVFIYNDAHKTKADKISYWNQSDLLKANGQVNSEVISRTNEEKIYIKSDRATAYPRSNKGTYLGNVKGQIKRNLEYEEDVYFESQRMDFDGSTGYVQLLNDVVIKKELMTASALKGELFLENYNKKLKYYVLYDDVKLTEKMNNNGIISERKAFGEKLTGIQKDGVVVLTGYPRVFQEGDVIKGNKIILRENNQIIEVDEANTMFTIKE